MTSNLETSLKSVLEFMLKTFDELERLKTMSFMVLRHIPIDSFVKLGNTEVLNAIPADELVEYLHVFTSVS